MAQIVAGTTQYVWSNIKIKTTTLTWHSDNNIVPIATKTAIALRAATTVQAQNEIKYQFSFLF